MEEDDGGGVGLLGHDLEVLERSAGHADGLGLEVGLGRRKRTSVGLGGGLHSRRGGAREGERRREVGVQ